MNSKNYILVCFIFLQVTLTGQSVVRLSIDELVAVLDTIRFNNKRVETLNELAYKLRDIQTEEAKRYANDAIALADSIKYPLGKSYSLMTLGLIAKRQKELTLAETYCLEALALRKKVASNKQVAAVYNNLGLLFQNNHSTKTRAYYQLGLSLLKNDSTASIKAMIHSNYGNFLRDEEVYDQALLHLDSALTIRRTLGKERAIGNTFLNLASLYFEMGDSSQFTQSVDSIFFFFNRINYQLGLAKGYNLKGKNLFLKGIYDQAKQHFEIAISLSEKSEKDRYTFLRNLGGVEIRQKLFDKALDTHKKCLAYFSSIGDDREVAALLINIGTIFYEQFKHQEAIIYYEKALDQLTNINDIALRAKALLFLSASYGYNNEYQKSSQIGTQYLLVRDSLYQQKSKGLNNLLDQKEFLVQNAELKRREVKKELVIETQKSEQFLLYLILGSFLLFFLILLIVMLFLNHRKEKKIADLKVNELLTESERTARYARLEEQEKERNRIAQDLHDGLGSKFTAIKFSLGFVESTLTNIKEENKIHYEKVNQLIDEACDEVRNIAHDLKNSTLANFGLKIALESSIELLQIDKPQIVLQIYNLDNRLSNKIEINIYLIIQELIGNTLKHAKANKLTIQLNRFESLLNITVEDDGIGFRQEQPKTGMGLNSIETRVHSLNGKINIDSRKGHGTTIMIDIPLLPNNK